jgi:hypothetical protein
VNKGFHLTAGIAVLLEPKASSGERGCDVIAYVSPSIGKVRGPFGLEVGVPIGWYFEGSTEGHRYEQDGGADRIMPYSKVGFNQDGRGKIALVGQLRLLGWLPLPSSLTLIYSYDFRNWTPYVAGKYLTAVSGADDEFVPCLSLGIEGQIIGSPGIEFGLLRRTCYGCGWEINDKRWDYYLGGKFIFK